MRTNVRLSTTYATTRTALAVEASSLRYMNYLMISPESAIGRGWDDLVDDDDDGT